MKNARNKRTPNNESNETKNKYVNTENRVVVTRGASLISQLIKNPPAMQETLVQFLGWEEPLEEGMVAHASILA